MSIFAELNKQNTEVVAEVTTKDIEKSFKEYAAAEHAANVLSNAATVIKHFAEEGITAIAADSINIHIDNANALTQSEITRKFTAEDFSDEATPEARTVIAAASAEDFKSTAKAAAAKAYEMLKKFIKKIWDWLTGVGRRDKEVKEAAAELHEEIKEERKEEAKKPKTKKEKKEIHRRKASQYLFIGHKYDPKKSLEVLHHQIDRIIAVAKIPNVRNFISRMETIFKKSWSDGEQERNEFFRNEVESLMKQNDDPTTHEYSILNNGLTIRTMANNAITAQRLGAYYTDSAFDIPLEDHEIDQMLDFIKHDDSIGKIEKHIKALNEQLKIASDYIFKSDDEFKALSARMYLDTYINHIHITSSIKALSIIAEDHLKTVSAVQSLIKWSVANR